MNTDRSRMRPNSIAFACMKALDDGPGTTAEVAAEIGQTPRLTCTHLCLLYTRGKISRAPMPNAGTRGRQAWLWMLPEHATASAAK